MPVYRMVSQPASLRALAVFHIADGNMASTFRNRALTCIVACAGMADGTAALDFFLICFNLGAVELQDRGLL